MHSLNPFSDDGLRIKLSKKAEVYIFLHKYFQFDVDKDQSEAFLFYAFMLPFLTLDFHILK